MNHTFVVLAYKESLDLERCIKSVLNQKYKSKVVIATSTPNDYIKEIASKYNLRVIVNKNHIDIGGDFDFAISCSKTNLVTIAHQDDIYDYEYSYNIVNAYKDNKDAIILFTDYYEIKNNKHIDKNINLNIKRLLLKPLKKHNKSASIKLKRKALKYGCAICCPSVTFNIKRIKLPVFFGSSFMANVDWYAWEKLSKVNGKFIYVNKILMGHTISLETTTTKIINSGLRTNEDLEMLKKFWPNGIAKIINFFYKLAELSNK